MKRILDILFSTVMLVLGLPVFIMVALVVRVGLGAPILFIQVRPGLHGESFRILKFRTMHSRVDSAGATLPDAQRLPTVGKFLRATSLDELPELWNVLRGDMSLVGPRPLLEEYLPLYSARQARRHDVKPGITGWAQVNGRNAISWEQKFELDVWYVENQSFLLDMRILWLTIVSVLMRRGISAEGHATMPPFSGNGV